MAEAGRFAPSPLNSPTPIVVIQKMNVSSVNIIISQIFPENFIEILQVLQKISL